MVPQRVPDRGDRPGGHRQAGHAEPDEHQREHRVGRGLPADADGLARLLARAGGRVDEVEDGRLPRVEQVGQLAAQAVGRHRVLREVVGAQGDEVHLGEDLLRAQGGRGHLDHHADGRDAGRACPGGERARLGGRRDHRRHDPRRGPRRGLRRARGPRAGCPGARGASAPGGSRARRAPGSPRRAASRTRAACPRPRRACGRRPCGRRTSAARACRRPPGPPASAPSCSPGTAPRSGTGRRPRRRHRRRGRRPRRCRCWPAARPRGRRRWHRRPCPTPASARRSPAAPARHAGPRTGRA